MIGRPSASIAIDGDWSTLSPAEPTLPSTVSVADQTPDAERSRYKIDLEPSKLNQARCSTPLVSKTMLVCISSKFELMLKVLPQLPPVLSLYMMPSLAPP